VELGIARTNGTLILTVADDDGWGRAPSRRIMPRGDHRSGGSAWRQAALERPFLTLYGLNRRFSLRVVIVMIRRSSARGARAPVRKTAGHAVVAAVENSDGLLAAVRERAPDLCSGRMCGCLAFIHG